MGTHKKKRLVGEKLKQAIDNKRVSIQELSDFIDISPSIIYRYIKNVKTPSKSTLKKISEFFNLPEEYFTNDLYIMNDSIKGTANHNEYQSMNIDEKSKYARKILDKSIEYIKYQFEKEPLNEQYKISNREFESAQLAINPKAYTGSNLDKKFLEETALKLKELGINKTDDNLFDIIDENHLEFELDTRYSEEYLAGIIVGAYIAAPKENRQLFNKRNFLRFYDFNQVFSYYDYDFIESFNSFLSTLHEKSFDISRIELNSLIQNIETHKKEAPIKKERDLDSSDIRQINKINETLKKLDINYFVHKNDIHSICLYKILEDISTYNLNELQHDFYYALDYLEK